MSTRATICSAIRFVALGLLGSSGAMGQEAVEWLARGDSLLRVGAVQQADRAYRRALGGDRDHAAKIGIARAQMARGRWSDAGRQLDDLLKADTLDLHARYLRGICHREFARIGTPLSQRNERQAAAHFSFVARHDSLFRDVLYQAALQRFHDGDREEALHLAMRQVALKPEDPDGQLGLFHLFRLLLHGKKASEALAWLDSHPSEEASFFIGEVHRREGRSEAAERHFQHVLAERELLSAQPIYLALARIFFVQGRTEEAQRAVDRAIHEITSEAGARFVMEDFKVLMSAEELLEWTRCDEPEEWIAFFEDFWYRREPLPSSGLRVRLAEHYRRLWVAERDYVYRGVRSWHQLPDRLELFSFPAAYYLNDALNDKGLIYVRHGEPSERVMTVGGMEDIFNLSPDSPIAAAGLSRDVNLALDRGAVESWRYESPRMEFHFMVGSVANGWFLVPTVSGLKAFEDREHWGGAYARAANVLRDLGRDQSAGRISAVAGGGSGDSTSGPGIVFVPQSPGGESADRRLLPELLELRDRIVRASHETVTTGLTTDRHTWTAAVEPIDMPSIAAAFRGEGGKTRLELHYALPVGVVSQAVDESADHVEVEVGMSLQDIHWRPVERVLEVKRLPTSADMTAAFYDFLSVTVPPDSVQINVHARTIEGHKLTGYRVARRLPAFPAGEPGISDLLTAYRIVPAFQLSRFNRHGLHLRVNPFGRFRVSDPVFVYFELYDLKKDTDGRTRFSVEYTLVPTAERRGLRRLFGGDSRPSLSLRFDRVALEDSPVEHAEIDVGSVAPGEYRLEVTVRQGSAGEPLRSSIPIRLTR